MSHHEALRRAELFSAGRVTGARDLDGAIAVPGKHSSVPPIQRKEGPSGVPAVDPFAESIHLDQYAQGTDPGDLNECGPTCVLMIVRAMGLEGELKQRIAKDPEKVTLQNEIKYVRRIGGHQGIKAMEMSKVRDILTAVILDLGYDPKRFDLDAQLAQRIEGLKQADDTKTGQAEAFIRANAGPGTAVIALGKPNDAAWGWGGMDDTEHRKVWGSSKDERGRVHYGPVPQAIPDAGGHFVLIWRRDPEVDEFTVLDPSWAHPKAGITMAEIHEFLYQRKDDHGQPGAIVLQAVPFAAIEANVKASAQPKAAPGATPTAPAAATGGGAPLPGPTRAKMEHALGADFSGVRVHEDDRAAAAGALAYAQGDQLHFAPGQYAPGTPDGDRLIGHELAHVVQQRQGRVPAAGHTGVVDDPALEAEADALGDHAARFGPRNVLEELYHIADLHRAEAKALLAPGAPEPDPDTIHAELRFASQRVRDLAAGMPDPDLKSAATVANDAIVAVYQALAVRAADRASTDYAELDTENERKDAIKAIQAAAGGRQGKDDYCGEFVHGQYASAGLAAELQQVFNHTMNVQDFFSYVVQFNPGRVPQWIQPAGDPHWLDVQSYHKARRSLRTLVDETVVKAAQHAGTLDRIMRPGDVITFYRGANKPLVADHTAMVRSVSATGFQTIEGNTFVTNAHGQETGMRMRNDAGTPMGGIGTNDWTTEPGRAGFEQDNDLAEHAFAHVFFIGRPSVVDFETGHHYAFTKP